MAKWTPDPFCRNYTGETTTLFVRFYCSKLTINATTCLPNESPEEAEQIQNLCNSADVMFEVLFWFSLISGIIGNGLAVFTIASLPLSTATFYVGLLALVDMVAVAVKATRYFLVENHVIIRYKTAENVLHMLEDFSRSYSHWLLVLICIERFLTVQFPIHKRFIFTVGHARVIALLLAVVLFAFWNGIVWGLGYFHSQIFHITSILYSLLPLFLIIVFISLISRKLHKIQQKRKTLNAHVKATVQVSGGDEDSRNPRLSQCLTVVTRNPLQEIARLENSITTMMMVAAICFTILLMPCVLIWYMYHYLSDHWNTPYLRAVWHLLHNLAQGLTFLNLSMNFFLYFLSAKRFRTQLYKVLLRRFRPSRRSSLKMQHSSHSSRDQLPLQPLRNSFSDTTQFIPGRTESSNGEPRQTLRVSKWSTNGL